MIVCFIPLDVEAIISKFKGLAPGVLSIKVPAFVDPVGLTNLSDAFSITLTCSLVEYNTS